MTDIKLLTQAREALINKDAVECYDSGTEICTCTLCEISRYITTRERLTEKQFRGTLFDDFWKEFVIKDDSGIHIEAEPYDIWNWFVINFE